MKENGGKNERQTGTGISRLYLLLAMLALVWTLKTCVPAVDTAITKIAGAAQKTKTVQAFSALTAFANCLSAGLSGRARDVLNAASI